MAKVNRRSYLEDEYRQVFRNMTYPERVDGYEPEAFVRAAKEMGARVVAADVRTQCYSLHDTEVYVKDPVLGERNHVAATADACRKYGLKFIGYVAPRSFEVWFRKKPEWNQRRSDGRVVGCGHWKTDACYNTGFGDFLAAELAEITRNYRPHGFYIDGVLLESQACYCKACRKIFRAEFGRDMPARPDWDSPEWYDFIDWRYRQVEVGARKLERAVHAIDPRVEFIHNCPHAWCGWYSAQSWRPAQVFNRVGTETVLDVCPLEGSQRLWSLATHTVHRVLFTRMLGGGRKSHSYTYFPGGVPEAEAAAEINHVLASGGIPCIQGCSPFLDRLMDRIARVEPFLTKSEEVRSVALVTSDLTRDAYYRDDDKAYFAEIHGPFKALIESHAPLQLVGDHQIDEGDLRGFDCLVMGNVTTLSKKGWKNVRGYVEKGGSVLATYKTGSVDVAGSLPGKRLLWPGSGLASLGDIETQKPWYVNPDGTPQAHISPAPNQSMLMDDARARSFGLDFSVSTEGGGWCEYEMPGYVDKNLHVPAKALRISAGKGWETILEMIYSEKCEPPRQRTPALLRKKFGRGYVYYLNCDIGDYLSKNDSIPWRSVLNKIIRMAAPRFPVELEGPECLYLSVWRQKKQKRYVIHLVNDLSTAGRPGSREKMRTDVVAVDARMTVKIPGARSVKQVVGDASVRTRKRADGIRVDLKGIGEHVILVVET